MKQYNNNVVLYGIGDICSPSQLEFTRAANILQRP